MTTNAGAVLPFGNEPAITNEAALTEHLFQMLRSGSSVADRSQDFDEERRDVARAFGRFAASLRRGHAWGRVATAQRAGLNPLYLLQLEEGVVHPAAVPAFAVRRLAAAVELPLDEWPVWPWPEEPTDDRRTLEAQLPTNRGLAFGRQLAVWRQERGWSERDAAAATGVPLGDLMRIETGLMGEHGEEIPPWEVVALYRGVGRELGDWPVVSTIHALEHDPVPNTDNFAILRSAWPVEWGRGFAWRGDRYWVAPALRPGMPWKREAVLRIWSWRREPRGTRTEEVEGEAWWSAPEPGPWEAVVAKIESVFADDQGLYGWLLDSEDGPGPERFLVDRL